MMYNMKYMETEQKYIENWKLCDYTYCPQIINQLIDHHVSIQTERALLRHQLAELYDIKKVVQIMEYIDANRSEIVSVRGIEGNSVYLLLNFGLSRLILKDYVFGKVELSKLLFMSLEEITKQLGVSVYTGQKILEACRFALHKLVKDSDFRKQEVLRKDVCDFFRGTDASYTFQEIEEGMLWRSEPDLLTGILSQLVEEDLIFLDEDRYINKNIYVHRSLSEVIDNMHDETAKQVVVRRLYGQTMEAIGMRMEPPISRARVGQIFHSELDHFPAVKEDVYKDLLAKYDLDKDTFYALTDAMEPTWGYIHERYREELDGTKIKLSGRVLSTQMARELSVSTKKLTAYLEEHYVRVQDTWVSRHDKNGFLQAVCRTFDGYFQKEDVIARYNQILMEVYPQKAEEWQMTDFRPPLVLKQGYLINSAKKGLRYRIINRSLVQSIMKEVRISQYQNTIISTKKLFEDHLDVMEKYDIRDQYELHSLLRTGKDRYHLDDNQMEFSRMPMLQFGQGKENEIVKREMKAMAPINVDDFSRIMARKYGYDIGSFMSYLRRNFNVYIEENRIDIVDEEVLESADFRKAKSLLGKDFYFIEDFRDLIESHHMTSKLLDPYVIRRMGYKSYTGYVLKDPLTPGKYFDDWIIHHCKEITSRHLEIQSFNHSLDRLENQLEVFEWTRDHYVTLASLKISKKELHTFVENILSVLDEGQFFTERYLSLQNYVDPKLSNTFFKSLLKSSDNVQMMSLGGSWIFQKGKTQPDLRIFFEQIIKEQPGITIVGCLSYLRQWYNIKMDRHALQERLLECGFYYSADTERIYLQKPKSIFRQERLF